jgi:uracil-DNA glycosylase
LICARVASLIETSKSNLGIYHGSPMNVNASSETGTDYIRDFKEIGL